MAQPNWVRGDKLTARLQSEVLRRFVHRFTGEHTPDWARLGLGRPDRKPYTPICATDREWLAGTEFAVTKSGELDARARYCRCTLIHPEMQS